MKADDILFVRRGEDRIGDVAIVYEGFDRILTAQEIDIVRVFDAENEHGVTPFLLLYLLAHPQVKAQYRAQDLLRDDHLECRRPLARGAAADSALGRRASDDQ